MAWNRNSEDDVSTQSDHGARTHPGPGGVLVTSPISSSQPSVQSPLQIAEDIDALALQLNVRIFAAESALKCGGTFHYLTSLTPKSLEISSKA